MSQYDRIKANHATCRDRMSSSEWKNFAVKGKPYNCPVCDKGPYERGVDPAKEMIEEAYRK